MAIGNTLPTLYDQIKRLDPDGGFAKIVEILSAKNAVLEDAVAMEGNLPTGLRFTTRVAEPTVGWRKLNEGVAPSKSQTEQVDEVCGMLEGYSQVDVDLASLNGNEAAFRASEDSAFTSALGKTAADAIFYGNVTLDPEKIHGFTPRFPSGLTTPDWSTPSKANQVLGAGGSGSDLSSIWFVTWGPDTCHLIYPKGSKAGLSMEDLGKQIIRDSNGKMYTAYVTRWAWKLGLAIRDFRHIVRLANFDNGTLPTSTLIESMVEAYHRLYDMNAGRTVIYCNRHVATVLHKAALAKANVNLTFDNYAGKPVTSFMGLPIRICDTLRVNESQVTIS